MKLVLKIYLPLAAQVLYCSGKERLVPCFVRDVAKANFMMMMPQQSIR
jgi:hypothetical protein